MAVQILNDSPLAVAFLAGRVRAQHPQLTVMVKGAFGLLPNGETAPRKRPLFSGDVSWDENGGSCRYASDFAPFKPRADVVVVGSCHAHGKPTARVTFGLGRLEKTLVVFGERRFVDRTIRTAKPSEPAAFDAMPLRYERAFGGAGFDHNPVGVGFGESSRLPNVELPDSLIRSPTDAPPPAGLGPLDRRWAQRTSRMGTYGPDWLKTRWPYFPEDFDWGYFNAAPADQQLPFLRGDEPWFVAGMHADVERYASRLPGVRPRCFLRRADERADIEEVSLVLDTVAIDVEAAELVLVWRGLVDVATRHFEEIQQALLVTEALAEAPLPAAHYHDRSRWDAPEPNEEELAAADEALAGVPEAAAPPPEEPPEPDLDEEAEVEASIAQLVEAKADPALLERLTGVTTVAAFIAICMAHMKEAGEVENEADDAAAADDDDPSSLASIQKQLEDAGVDPELRARAAEETTRGGLAAVLMAGLPEPEGADDRRARRELVETLRAEGEAEEMAIRAVEAEPRAVRGERLTRDEVIALVHTNTSLVGANLTAVDLSELDLHGVDLSRAKLDGARLDRAVLTGARLGGATLRGARLEGAKLDDAVAEGAAFDEAVLKGADLSRANLGGAALAKADLSGAVLVDADLTGADLSLAELRGARLVSASLDGATLRGTVLSNADATRASLRKATISDADLSGAKLDGASLIGCVIERVNLSGASLRDAFLEKASVSATDFDGVELGGMRARGARFHDGRFGGVRAAGSKWAGADLRGADFTKAVLVRADFSGANLTDACFRQARLESANLSRATLAGAKLIQANLLQARLGGADLSGADCRASNLFASDMFEAIVDGARFDKANLGRTCVAARGTT